MRSDSEKAVRIAAIPSSQPCIEVMTNPAFYKGTAFTDAEREALGIRGLLPPRVFSEHEQVHRFMSTFKDRHTDLERYLDLIGLQDRNETLFYRVLIDNLEEMLPLVYTPTVGLACQVYGHIFRRPRGLFVSVEDRGRIPQVLDNWPEKEIDIIVVTDGERILGLGDLGANGMGIPVGKLTLYTACGGIDPRRCLPITLDVGTNNEDLLKAPFYIGSLQHRLWGREYDTFLDEFVTAVQEKFPGALLHFEDFSTTNAFGLLDRYRKRYLTYNDDIQGTAAVVLAGILSSSRITGTKLTEQKLLLFGAGEAGLGIANLFVATLVQEGMSETEARQRCWLYDSKGLVVRDRERLNELKRPFAHQLENTRTLQAAIEKLEPTALIGASGQPQTFDRQSIETMGQINARPLILALSNPTSKSECTAEQAYTWSQGNVLFASGSPYPPVILEDRTYTPGLCNNVYIFPGLGLGVIASGSRLVTDKMIYTAAQVLARAVTDRELSQGGLFPALSRIREVSALIGSAVAKVAFQEDLATRTQPQDLLKSIKSLIHEPNYRTYLG